MAPQHLWLSEATSVFEPMIKFLAFAFRANFWFRVVVSWYLTGACFHLNFFVFCLILQDRHHWFSSRTGSWFPQHLAFWICVAFYVLLSTIATVVVVAAATLHEFTFQAPLLELLLSKVQAHYPTFLFQAQSASEDGLAPFGIQIP